MILTLPPGASRHLARYTRRELVAGLARRGGVLEQTRSILGAELILAFRKPGGPARTA